VLLPAPLRGLGSVRRGADRARVVRRMARLVAGVLPAARLAGHLHPDLPGRLPRHLLLLSEGVLPQLLRLAPGLRRESAAREEVSRRDAAPPVPEPPPLRALRGGRLHLPPLLG